MKKEGLDKKYSFFAVVLLMAIYLLVYFLDPLKSPVYATIFTLGFVIFFIIFFLIVVFLFEMSSGKKLEYLNSILDDCFVHFLGESIALIFSFFFYLTLVSAFDLGIGSLVSLQLVAFLIISSFNHIHYKNKRTIGFFVLFGFILLLIGFLSQYHRFFLVFTSVSLVLFSAVAYRVFRVEVPKEVNR